MRSMTPLLKSSCVQIFKSYYQCLAYNLMLQSSKITVTPPELSPEVLNTEYDNQYG